MTFIDIDTLTVKFIKKSTGSGIAKFFFNENGKYILQRGTQMTNSI